MKETGCFCGTEEVKMNDTYRIKGKVLDRGNQPVSGIMAKAYDDRGVFISGASTDARGVVDFAFGVPPKGIKIIKDGRIIGIKDVADIGIVDGVIDFGDVIICMIPPEEWHIKGIVRDSMSGDPLPGLTVEVWDVDTSFTGGPYYDPLGEEVTDSAGAFSVWFDGSIFEREASWVGEVYPDVVIKVKNSLGVLIHETPLDPNVSGVPHICEPYCLHKGKEYLIEIDYVTATINKIGPVNVADITASGRASFHGIADRPFGGDTTIGGRVWGAKVDQWKLYYAADFVDSGDARFSGLAPSSPDPTGFSMIAQGTNKVWDGPIGTWNTGSLEGTHTAILVVWDKDGNEYHATQVVYLHNTIITPAAQISSPAAGSTVVKASTGTVEIMGTASDDFFLNFDLLWVGPTQTELTSAGITYPSAGNHTPVVGGKLGEWNISSMPTGPYCVRLGVHDRTILNDDGIHYKHHDWTWSTVTITA
jgi:hypothetical protein